MTKKQFDKNVNAIIDKYPTVETDKHGQNKIITPAGTWLFNLRHDSETITMLQSRFVDYHEAEFKRLVSKYHAPSEHSRKWNHYDSDPNWILDFLNETLTALTKDK